MEEKVMEQVAEKVVEEAVKNEAAVKAVEKAGDGIAKMALKVNKLEGAIGITLIAGMAIAVWEGGKFVVKKVKGSRDAKKAENNGVTMAENGSEVITDEEKALENE